MQALIDIGDGHGDGGSVLGLASFRSTRLVGQPCSHQSGEAVRWLTQLPEHSVVAHPVYSESPSDVAENDVQLAVVLIDDATAVG